MPEINIIFEDDNIVVINKPAGVVVNKAASVSTMTVQEWAGARFGIKGSVGDKLTESGEYNLEYEFGSRGGVVHRLDKETSGIMVIAKNVSSFGKLKEQFLGRSVEKKYIALVHGRLSPAEGVIDASLGRLPWNRTRFGVLEGGRSAVTNYKVIEYRNYNGEILSLVEVAPKTGRTHQIRVHLRHLGFPIFADELYAGRKQSKKDRKLLRRHFLHALSIRFKHPDIDKVVEYVADLTPELEEFLENTEKVL